MRCTARTLKRRRCKNNAQADRKMCKLHVYKFFAPLFPFSLSSEVTLSKSEWVGFCRQFKNTFLALFPKDIIECVYPYLIALFCLKFRSREFMNFSSFTPQLYYECIMINPFLLRYVDTNYLTYDMCMSAVKRYGYSLSDIPVQLMTPELCTAAVRQNGFVLGTVPKSFITYDLCFIAIQETGWALKYVPTKFRTVELCSVALKHNSLIWIHVPKNIQKKLKIIFVL